MSPRRRNLLILAAGAAIASILAAAANQRDFVIYNHSPSVPTGFYVRSSAPVEPGVFVTVRARDVAPGEAERRQFDDSSDRFIKRVVAAAGARVCGDGRQLRIEGEDIVVIGADDAAGDDGDHERGRAAVVRVLHGDDEVHQRIAGWRGCRVLADGEVLLLGDTPDSFDGRYWGPVSIDLIEGVWRQF